jgi:tRNA pseudouridine55 synthase
VQELSGIIVVDKPRDWTSHDVVNKMRRIAGTKKIGHLGTLDPAATGVLPLVLNKATRLARFFTKNDKIYEGAIYFGYSTSTYDAGGEPTSPVRQVSPEPGQLPALLAPFRGTIQQTPPPISAKKIGGTPAYKLARKNVEVALKPVEVTVHSLELLGLDGPRIHVRVHCSAGTYVRSIAHGLGQSLGCGAFLESLRRTQSGDFKIEQARTLAQLEELAAEGRLQEALLPAAELLPEFPSETVDAITTGQIRQGRDFRTSPFRVARGARYVKAISPGGELVAIGEAKLPNVYHPVVVF